MLERHYDRLHEELRDEYDAWRSAEGDAIQRYGDWAKVFLEACDLGRGPWPTPRGDEVDSWFDDDGRRDGRVTIGMLALRGLHASGRLGATTNELQRRTGVISGGFGGACVTLQKSGVVSRLGELR